MQHIGADSENLSAVNTDENPFKVSIDITAAGIAANNLSSRESGYSNAIKNDAILGVSPEFVYTDGLKVEDVVINFDIKDSAANNTNGKYTSLSDEFVGIKRLNVFKFFEDTNMLLPIETFHDVESGRVYTHVDELGTYCLMDMEVWLEGLDITSEENVSNEIAPVLYSARTYSVDEENNEEEQKCLDVVLVAYPNKSLLDTTKSELKITCKSIFEQAEKENIDARIYFVSFLGSSIETPDGNIYACSYEEAEEIIDRHAGITSALDEKSYALYKALNYSANNCVPQFRENSDRFCFVIDVCGFPQVDSGIVAIATFNKNNVRLSFAYNPNNINVLNYELLSSGACEEAVLGGGRFNFEDFIIREIFGKHENEYPIISAVGWKRINLDAPITEEYFTRSIAIDNDPSLRDGVINLNKYADTDKDGLLDLEEIMFRNEDGKDLISFDSNGNAVLPNFEDCTGALPQNRKLFYVKNGLLRYADVAKFQDLYKLRILPIKSDPTSEDGDNDSVNDADEVKMENKNPLIIDNVRILYNEKYKNEADVDEYLNDVYKVADSEKLVEYIMEDYYDTASKVDVNSISDEWWQVYCYRLNKYVKEAYTTKIMPAEVHYFRNNLNRAPLTLDNLLELNDRKNEWLLLPVDESVFHMYGTGGEFNIKFVSSDVDQVFEAVYDMSGMLLTHQNDPHSCSTYNYCGPSDKFSHAMLDVIPYYLYYSVPDIENPYHEVFTNLGIDLALTAIDNRFIFSITDEICELASVENRLKYYSNPIAQDYRQSQVLCKLYVDCIVDTNEHKYGRGERPI